MTNPLLRDHENMSHLKTHSIFQTPPVRRTIYLSASCIYWTWSCITHTIQTHQKLDRRVDNAKLDGFGIHHVSSRALPGHSTKNCSRVSFRFAKVPPNHRVSPFFTCDLQLNCWWGIGNNDAVLVPLITVLSMTRGKLHFDGFGKTGLH